MQYGSMMINHVILTVSVLLSILLVGCKDIDRPDSKASSPSDEKILAELENVAHCFHTATTLLQSEPSDPKQFAAFLRRAKTEILKASKDATQRQKFQHLKWDATGSTMITSSGKPIECRMVERSHDNYGPEGTALQTKYEFFIPGTHYQASTVIELSMRIEK